ncbi:MAG: SUMF1/EgtB/PvdO family nonheme iron enzyme [Pseudomonadota bacterium]
MRKAYDAILAQERFAQLNELIDVVGSSGEIAFQEYQHLVKKAVDVGLVQDEARQYILEYCKKNNCLVDLPPDKPARQDKIDEPRQVQRWVWGGVGLLSLVFLVVWLVSPSKVEDGGKVFQDRLKDGSFGPEMVWIPAGSFRMGDIQGGGWNSEKPVHRVSIRQGFAMGRYEVTFAEYDKFAEATGREKPSDLGWGRGNRPVINVSWHDAVAYTQWLSQQTGKKYRLPTEAEWEYAARAGTETKYWWGNTASPESMPV